MVPASGQPPVSAGRPALQRDAAAPRCGERPRPCRQVRLVFRGSGFATGIRQWLSSGAQFRRRNCLAESAQRVPRKLNMTYLKSRLERSAAVSPPISWMQRPA